MRKSSFHDDFEAGGEMESSNFDERLQREVFPMEILISGKLQTCAQVG